MSEENRNFITAYEEIKKVERKLHNALKDPKLANSRAGLLELKEILDGMKWSLGRNLLNCGEYERTLALYHSLPWRIHGEKICDGIATALIGLGHYNEAKRVLEKGLKKYPDSHLLWVDMGILQEYLGNKFEALRCLDIALQFGPKDNSPGLSAKASILIGLEWYGDAIQIYNDLIEKDPKDPSYFADRGYCALEMGYPREALKDYQHAMEVWEHSEGVYDGIDIYLGLYSTYSELGMKKEAMEIALEGLKRFPDEDPDLYYNAGISFFKMGWQREAVEVFKKGVDKFPEDEELKTFFKEVEEDLDDPNRGEKPPNLGMILVMALIQKKMRRKR